MFSELARDTERWERVKECSEMLEIDASGVITWITRPAEELFGYFIRNELVGKLVEIIVPDAVKPAHPGYRDLFKTNPRMRSMGTKRVVQGQHRDGHTFAITIKLSASASGGEYRALAIIADMTEPTNNKVGT
jgi:PAS domain S-box-containing protein